MRIKQVMIILVNLLMLSLPLLPGQVWWEDSGRSFDFDLSPFKILVLLGEEFDYHELTVIKNHWEKWGAEVVIAGSDKILTGHLWSVSSKGWEKAEYRNIQPDLMLAEVQIDHYQAIFLPGGGSPKNLIETKRNQVVGIIRDAYDKGMLVSAICHGPFALAEAGVVKGHEITCHPEIVTDIIKAGGQYVKEVKVVDRNILTGNFPYFESFASGVAEKLLYPDQKQKSRFMELESHPAVKAVKERNDVWMFKDKEVEPFVLQELLHLGASVSSAGDSQSWRFVLVKDSYTKEQVLDRYLEEKEEDYLKRGIPLERVRAYMSKIFEAPVLIFAFLNAEENPGSLYSSETRELWNIQALAAACQNILLAAEAMELGTHWLSSMGVIEPQIERILRIPEQARLMTVIALGHPADRSFPPLRRSLSEVVFYEKWGKMQDRRE
jgi:protease I